MKNYTIYILFSLLMPIVCFGQSLDSLTLEQFIGLAQQQNIAKERAMLNLAQAKLDYAIFKTNFKPALDFTANIPNYSKTFSETVQPNGSIAFQSITYNNSGFGLSLSQNVAKTGGWFYVNTNLQRFDDFENNVNSYNGSPIQVGFSQPLFGFNSLKWEQKIAPIRVEEAEKQYQADLAQIKVEANRLFFALLTAYQDLEIANLNKESNNTLYEIAKERYKLGKISDNNLLQLQLRLISATKNQQRAAQAVRSASADVMSYLGLPYQTKSIKPIIPIVQNVAAIEFESTMKAVLKNRPEVATYNRLAMEADRDMERAKRENGISANLNASFGFARSSNQLSEVYTNPQQAQFLAMELNVPIIDGGLRKTRMEKAKVSQDYLAKLKTQVFLDLENQVRILVEQFQTIQQELQLAKEIQTVAQKRFTIAKESFVLGAISTTELIFAQQEKDLAIRDYVATLSQYWQVYFEMERLTIQ